MTRIDTPDVGADVKKYDKKQLIDSIQAMSEREYAMVVKAVKAVEAMRENKYPFMGNFMQMKLIESGERFSCSMPITRDILNPYRIVYGGITALLADMAMGWMLEELIDQKDKVVTLDMNVNYHNPGRGKELIAHCRLTHRAQKIMQATCRIVNDRGEVIVTATGTFLHLHRSGREQAD
ncbi:PaaI family thioesterase [Ammoniphilus sp. CFH 90114]|uniref:PaaI family thioesterase n=1 Tax=Ammoniphilus sp. CFH 90114 TaxID=2493665 RepID=UPI00100F4E08|nr:PaaI family thioesterase [Ammoniphilus sp. CFH 90114]RXT08198.1 PaaI family thioesterase [Ammoniphilus sp. CFH 90114]